MRSSLYPSKNVLGRCYIALKRFYRKGRLTMQKKRRNEKKSELSTFRRELFPRVHFTRPAKRILDGNTPLLHTIFICFVSCSLVLIILLYSFSFKSVHDVCMVTQNIKTKINNNVRKRV